MRGWYESDRGAAVVEMMLVLPFLILLFSVIFEIGQGAQTASIAASAARAAAQYVVMNPPPTAALTSAYQQTLQQVVVNDAGVSGVTLTSASASCSCYPNSNTDSCSYGGSCGNATDHARNYISISVTGTYLSISPIHFITTKNGRGAITESTIIQLPS